MDYSNLSYEEINKLVGAIVSRDKLSITASNGKTLIHRFSDCGEFKGICLGWKEFDPCNNPTDAWPILLKNRISIEFDSSYDGDEPAEWVKASVNAREHFSHSTCNKALRAAMIVFLMMQEAKNG